MMKYIWFSFILILWVTALSADEGRGYSLNIKEESWVEKVDFNRELEVKESQIRAGVYYLLVDKQILVDGDSEKEYIHNVVKIENESGLENYSQLDFSFEPSYQTITIHSIKIYREDKQIEQLDYSDLKIIEENGSQDYLIYDETRTLNILLNDVRVGDTIEYSYTRYGSNPIFKNRYFDTFYLGWGFPLEKLSYRVIASEDRELFTKSFMTESEPEIVRRADGFREYLLKAEQVKAFDYEDYMPAWSDPYPRVQFTEFRDWSEVNELFLEHYSVSEESKAAIEEDFKKIIKFHDVDEYAVRDLVQFVRTSIRYLGIAIGVGSHKPSLPEEVLERRYGDCKDKTMLLVAFLQKLGIEAYPALVDTDMGMVLDNYLPSPGLFNHVIVKATLNGREYWIDPTLTYQRGLLEYSYHYDYGYSLVLKEGSKRLVKMPEEQPDKPNKSVEETFDLRSGVDKSGKLIVKTTYRGNSAYNIREDLAYYTAEELQDDYKNYYAESYPSIEVEKGFVTNDNEDLDKVVTEEYYRIDEIWEFDKEKSYHKVSFYPDDLLYYIARPDKGEEEDRKFPYQLNHPINIRYSTRVLLPDDGWSFKRKSREIDNRFFFFFHNFVHVKQENALYIVYQFKSKRDYLEADEIEEYNKELKRALDNIGYYIYDGDKHRSTTGLIAFIVMALLTAIVVGTFFIVDRFKNREKYAMKAKLKVAHKKPDYHHKCLICGRTDLTNPELSFRYCDDCSSESCYCIEHIADHKHI